MFATELACMYQPGYAVQGMHYTNKSPVYIELARRSCSNIRAASARAVCPHANARTVLQLYCAQLHKRLSHTAFTASATSSHTDLHHIICSLRTSAARAPHVLASTLAALAALCCTCAQLLCGYVLLFHARQGSAALTSVECNAAFPAHELCLHTCDIG
eukprot:15267-Heterococcus_DN1.PRE.1